MVSLVICVYTFDFYICRLPLLIGELVGLIVFSVKAYKQWRLLYKHEDANGDGLYRGVVFTGLVIYLLLVMLAEVLTIIRLNSPGFGLNAALCLIPLPLAQIIIIVISLIPFLNFFQRRLSADNENLREMLIAL